MVLDPLQCQKLVSESKIEGTPGKRLASRGESQRSQPVVETHIDDGCALRLNETNTDRINCERTRMILCLTRVLAL
jgi:hypothetical protein